MRNLLDAKIYLSVKFREGEGESMRVWYDMVNVIFGDKNSMSTREKGKQEMVEFIRSKISPTY